MFMKFISSSIRHFSRLFPFFTRTSFSSSHIASHTLIAYRNNLATFLRQHVVHVITITLIRPAISSVNENLFSSPFSTCRSQSFSSYSAKLDPITLLVYDEVWLLLSTVPEQITKGLLFLLNFHWNFSEEGVSFLVLQSFAAFTY